MSKNPQNWWKSTKIANIDRKSLHIFGATWRISMTFSGKIWLMIILKVTKNQDFTLFLEDTFSEKSKKLCQTDLPAFSELIEYNMRNIFPEKSYTKWAEKLLQDLFLKNQNWACFWIKSVKSYSLLLLYAKLRATKIYWN